MISRFPILTLIVIALSACLLVGCFDTGGYGGWGGYGYPDYPVYGYAPYGWRNGGYAPVFDVHHPWEGHHDFGGHHDNFYRPPVARAGVGRIGGGGFHSGGGGSHGSGGRR
jgi:hypothetical protein